MSQAEPRPLTILLAALGGEGGGVLSMWLLAAATAEGYPVQGTSIPGVAQRTGATTYYIELLPTMPADAGGRSPVFALAPNPGTIDLMVTSELLETGRAMQNGFISPDRTTLIGSTHRLYAIGERTALGDGRFESGTILEAAAALAKRCVLFDMSKVTRETDSVISAVMLGAIAASGALPMGRKTFEQAIRDSGIAVDSNLNGFAAGFATAAAVRGVPQAEVPETRSAIDPPTAADLRAQAERSYPEAAWPVIREALARLVGYQDVAYATLYLDRLDPICALDRAGNGGDGSYSLTNQAGRYLATWMAYEDVIRVADLKTRKSRFARIAAEVAAEPGEPVVVVDYLKPGIEEICGLLPALLARPLLAWAERRGLTDRLNIGMHVKTTSISGFLLMWLLARLRPLRRMGYRFAEEQALIGRWIDLVRTAAERDLDLAREVSECARLVKGYGATHRRGRVNFLRLLDEVVAPALGSDPPWSLAAAVRRTREAALADPEGKALDEALATISAARAAAAAPDSPAAETERAAQRAAGE